MATLRAETLAREFHYNGIRIPDPGPELSVDQVRHLLTPQYPEIAVIRARGDRDGTTLYVHPRDRYKGLSNVCEQDDCGGPSITVLH